MVRGHESLLSPNECRQRLRETGDYQFFGSPTPHFLREGYAMLTMAAPLGDTSASETYWPSVIPPEIRLTEKQQAAASVEADKASIASAEAAAIEKDAEKELAQAEPAMLAAAEAVNCLSKSMLTELKSLPKPPAGVDKVPAAHPIPASSYSNLHIL